MSQSKRTAVYPGTFDPLTNGHMDIIGRAAALYDTLYIAVSDHGRKKTMFSLSERVQAIETALENQKIGNVKVIHFNNLLYSVVEELEAGVVVRGLRVTSDFDFEFQMASMNTLLSNKFETIFLMASTEHTMISSTNVKEVASMGGDVSSMVPAHVHKMLVKKYANQLHSNTSRYAEGS